MNTNLAKRLDAAINQYNANEDCGLCWWEVLDEIGDVTDDKQVLETIRAIEADAGVRQKDAVIYARGNDPEAVIEQIKKGSTYAAENGMVIVAVVTTPEEFDATLQGMEIDAVIVRDHSRLSRNSIGILQAIMVLQQLDIELHAIGE